MNKSKVVIISNKFDDVREAITGAMLLKAITAGGLTLENIIKRKAGSGRPGLNRVSGKLVSSIQTETLTESKTLAEVQVGTNTEYAAIHEFGGIVKPVTAKMLSWVDNGVRVFAKLVHIPARPYMRPAIDEHKTEVIESIEKTLERQIAQAVK